MQTVQDLQATLPKLKGSDFVRNAEGDLDIIYIEHTPRSFARDGHLYLSMENGDGAGCYFGKYNVDEYQDGIPYIADVLEAWAKEHKGYWEWQDCATIVFSK